MEALLEKVAALPDRRKQRVQQFAIWLMLRRRLITAEQAEDLRARDWQSFLEWLIEKLVGNGKAI